VIICAMGMDMILEGLGLHLASVFDSDVIILVVSVSVAIIEMIIKDVYIAENQRFAQILFIIILFTSCGYSLIQTVTDFASGSTILLAKGTLTRYGRLIIMNACFVVIGVVFVVKTALNHWKKYDNE
jgi:hypothetical protein